MPERIPPIGLGLWKIPNASAASVVADAIRLGYRHLDAACDYGNEVEVGQGIRAALAAGYCRRDELWVTSKLWNTYHRREHVRLACERSLRDLGLDYLDLYLIHFPIPQAFVPFEERYPPGWLFEPSAARPAMKLEPVTIAETWGAMEELVRAGLVRQIGISNFNTPLIRDLLAGATIRPSILQVEMHPYLTQEKLLRFCREVDITVTAFSPFGAMSYVPLGMAKAEESVLQQPIVRDIASRHQRSPGQVVLRWGIQRGTAVIPKTERSERLVENLGALSFELSEADMQAISSLNRHQRYNDPGVFCEAAFGTFCPIYD